MVVHVYDMVFIDTVMPVMDGLDTVREMRNLDGEEYKKMPIMSLIFCITLPIAIGLYWIVGSVIMIIWYRYY